MSTFGSNCLTRQFNKEPVSRPGEKSGERMKAFIRTIEKKYNLKFDNYWHFHKWTVENIAELWAEIWSFSGIIFSKPYDKVVDLGIPMEELPKWFEGAKVNVAENLLKYRDDNTAMILAGEDRDEVERLSYKQLYEETRTYSAALRKIGLQKGDIVACYMSNRKEAVIAMLAVISIGAIWAGGLPSLGAKTYVSSLEQVQPKILFTVDQFPQCKETHDLLQKVKDISEGLPSLRRVIIVPSRPESKQKDINCIKNSCFLDDFLETAHNADGTVPEMVFEQVSFSHPAFISCVAGITGLPNNILHGFGALLSGIRDIELHMNMQRKEIILLTSTAGWVSWNLTTYSLFVGSTMVLFEGDPFFLTPAYLWDMIDNLKITQLNLFPPLCDAMVARNYLPTERHHLSSLNMIQFIGSVVKPHSYDFVQKLKKDIRCGVVYGATEILGICMMWDDALPVYVEEISTSSLGVSLECLDDEGNAVFGEMGEFVISKHMPSLPLGFWGDTNGDMLKKSHFSKFPGKFVIGDLIMINPVTKGIIVFGRSDTTMKHGAYRFGSTEMCNVVKVFPEIQDSLCVGQYNKQKDERAVLFLQMKEGYSLNEGLVQKIRNIIAKELTPTHVPEVILEIPGIPYTANGKKCDIIVKKIINKMAHYPETVANSECLKFYYDIPEIQDF